MNLSLSAILVGFGLMVAQLLAALPWLCVAFLTRADLRSIRPAPGLWRWWRPYAPWVMQRLGIALAVCLLLPVLVQTMVQDRAGLEIVGRVYAALLQIQLTLDVFILGFAGLLAAWPKGGAVALAAFREGVRQWMFWLITLLALLLMLVSIFVPYFTFGEDYLMVKQLGYDTIMLAAVLFGALAASLSISEEIEGRTAITVMSKPVSRRQFMLGKFAGIILAALFMFGLLGVCFEGVLLVKHWWERLTPLSEMPEAAKLEFGRIGVIATPAGVNEVLRSWGLPSQTTDVLRGIAQWGAHTIDTLPGLILAFSQVAVLVALAVALATRVPMVVNLTTVLVVYFLAHLTPVLVARARAAQADAPSSAVPRLIGFVAGVFDTLLPDLGSFRMDPALISDAPPPGTLFAQYIASVTLYGIVYTVIILLFGLILFEDRDLA
jgi:hypothetical protein